MLHFEKRNRSGLACRPVVGGSNKNWLRMTSPPIRAVVHEQGGALLPPFLLAICTENTPAAWWNLPPRLDLPAPPVGVFLPHPKPGPGPCKTGGMGMDHRALLFKSRGDVANRPTEVMWAGCYKCGIDPNMGLRHGMGAGEARIHSINAQPQRILRILIVSK